MASVPITIVRRLFAQNEYISKLLLTNVALKDPEKSDSEYPK